MITHQDKLLEKVDDIKSTIKFQMKKVRTNKLYNFIHSIYAFVNSHVIKSPYLALRAPWIFMYLICTGVVSERCHWSRRTRSWWHSSEHLHCHELLGLASQETLAKCENLAHQVNHGQSSTVVLVAEYNFEPLHFVFLVMCVPLSSIRIHRPPEQPPLLYYHQLLVCAIDQLRLQIYVRLWNVLNIG